MKKIYIILILTIFSFHLIHAQEPVIDAWHQPVQKGINNLQIGDQVPDFKLAKIFNYDKKTASVADYNDRLIIFDFGNTHCAGCIAALPHLDSLQRIFNNQIQIFWVTYEKETEISKFWNTNKLTKNNTLPTIVEDSTVKAYFKHKTWPHEAWVYKGKVIAITEPEYVTVENIRKVLSGAKIDWPVKNDFYSFDGNKEPLFNLNPNQIDTASTFIQYAATSDYKEEVNAENGMGIVRNTNKHTVRTFFTNMSILNAYIYHWNNSGYTTNLVKPLVEITPNQIVWEVPNKSRFQYQSKAVSGYQQDWLRNNGICFESLNPDTGQTDQAIYKNVIKDLDGLLGLHVRWEKRKEKVLVMVRTPSYRSLKSKRRNVDPEDHLIVKGPLHRLSNVPLNIICYQMNKIEGNPYIFDESNVTEMIDLDLNFPSWKDIPAIRRSLNIHGLDLKEEERWVDKLVVSAAKEGTLLVDAKIQKSALSRRATQAKFKNPTDSENQIFMQTNKTKPGVILLPSGLQYKIIKQGKGPLPTKQDTVTVNYTGMLVNGKIFESSLESGIPSKFAISSVIKGWQEALKLMPQGSKWILYIPAELAYGTHTNQGQLPPNSNLIFEVELLRIEK